MDASAAIVSLCHTSTVRVQPAVPGSATTTHAPTLASRNSLTAHRPRVLMDEEEPSSDVGTPSAAANSAPAFQAAPGANHSHDGCFAYLPGPSDEQAVDRQLASIWSTISSEENLALDIDQLFDVDQHSCTVLQFAAKHGKLDDVLQALVLGARIDLANKTGVTPLMYACRGNHLDVAQLLLDWGASIDACADGKSTALHLAAQTGQGIVELLVQYHANLDNVDADGETALSLAIFANDIDTVSFLLGSGANHAHINKLHDDVLLSAVRLNRFDAVHVLLQHGVELENTDADNCTALFNAARNGHTEILALLIDHGANVDCWSPDGHTPLSIAFANQMFESAKMLIKPGQTNPYRTIRGQSYLQFAAEAGDTECVELLLNHWTMINYKGDIDATPLMLAARHNRKEVVALLAKNTCQELTCASLLTLPLNFMLGRRLEVDTQDRHGFSALAIAAERGHAEIVSMLIGIDANVDLADFAGNTPMHHAVRKGHAGTVETLLRQGADSTLKNKAGVTALQCAFERAAPDRRIIDMLRKTMNEHAGIR